MTKNVINSRKYFSYTEVIKNPSLPFSNSEKDTKGEFIPAQAIIDITFSDYFKLLDRINNKTLSV